MMFHITNTQIVCSTIASLLLVPLSSFAQEQIQNKDTAITSHLATGEPTSKSPEPKKVKRHFNVKNTFRQRVKGRNVTLQEVDPPVLPEQKSSPKQGANTHSTLEVPYNTAEQEPQDVEPMRFIGVSATVYGKGEKKQTYLKIWYNGKIAKAWSNINGNFLGGFSGFKANGREYMLMLGHSNAYDSRGKVKNLKAAARQGCPLDHWVFQSNRINFVVTEIEEGDEHLQQILGDPDSVSYIAFVQN